MRGSTALARWARHGLLVLVVVFAVIQLVPYGRDHGSGRAPSLRWPSGDAETLFRGACADCHTEQTVWPWYSNVAPMSWAVQRDVDAGRDAWNLSEEVDDLDDAAEELEDGSMPPARYTWAHSDARLSAQEREVLVRALLAMDERED